MTFSMAQQRGTVSDLTRYSVPSVPEEQVDKMMTQSGAPNSHNINRKQQGRHYTEILSLAAIAI